MLAISYTFAVVFNGKLDEESGEVGGACGENGRIPSTKDVMYASGEQEEKDDERKFVLGVPVLHQGCHQEAGAEDGDWRTVARCRIQWST